MEIPSRIENEDQILALTPLIKNLLILCDCFDEPLRSFRVVLYLDAPPLQGIMSLIVRLSIASSQLQGCQYLNNYPLQGLMEH